MPEHLKAFVVVMVLATATFTFARSPATAVSMAGDNFARRRNLWLAITTVIFIAHEFWIYIFGAAALLLLMTQRDADRFGTYYFILFAAPNIPADIPGFGIINYFFSINYVRVLALTILLPAFLSIQKQGDDKRLRSYPDRLIVAYIGLQFMLMLAASTFTNSLRHGVFYTFIDIFLPYYVASRSYKDLAGFRNVLMSFVIAALLQSAIVAFEFVRHWLLYASLADVLGVYWNMGKYLERDDILRVLGSTAHPIVLGYVMAVAICFMLYLRKSVPFAPAWWLGLAALAGGLVVPFSRGPWLGAGCMLLAFILVGPSPLKGLARLSMLGAVIAPILLLSPAGQKIIDYLPFVGSVGDETVTYRQTLVEVATQVILQNPLFGAYDYIYSPALEGLRQGEGIIDIVNSYVAVGLSSGLVGLSLFTGFFGAILFGIFRAMRTLPDKDSEAYLLGRVLFSTLTGILVTIATVSSVDTISTIYWSVAGLGAGYCTMLAREKSRVILPKPIGRQLQPGLSEGHPSVATQWARARAEA